MFERRFFMLAPNFHGATLLAKLLNAHPAVVSLGDTYPSNRFDQTSGCGELVSRCAFWHTVKQRIRAERYLDYPTLLPTYPHIVGGAMDRWLYNIFSPTALRRLMPCEDVRVFVDNYEKFLAAVYDLERERQPRVFVDGVKSVSRIKAMMAVGGRVNGVIHLVRNPGDYAKSVTRQSGRGISGLAAGALGWRLYHRQARKVGHHVPCCFEVSYEDLTESTNKVLGDLFDFMGVPTRDVEELRPHFRETWHFMGNISLMQFDGRLQRKQYPLTRLERFVIASAAGIAPVAQRGGTAKR